MANLTDQEERQRKTDRELYLKLVRANEDGVALTSDESQRLHKLLAHKPTNRFNLVFGKGVQKVPRRWER